MVMVWAEHHGATEIAPYREVSTEIAPYRKVSTEIALYREVSLIERGVH